MEQANAMLHALSEGTAVVTNMLAVLIVLFGSVIAVVQGTRWLVSPSYASNTPIREVWINYARWLVAALTFQLAGDIVETAGTPDWNDIGKLAAIAVVRTFLNFFLDRDLQEKREVSR